MHPPEPFWAQAFVTLTGRVLFIEVGVRFQDHTTVAMAAEAGTCSNKRARRLQPRDTEEETDFNSIQFNFNLIQFQDQTGKLQFNSISIQFEFNFNSRIGEAHFNLVQFQFNFSSIQFHSVLFPRIR